MRQGQAVSRQHQRANAGDNKSPSCAVLQRLAGETRAQHRPKPVDQSMRLGSIDFVPVHEDEREWPRGQDPANRAAHPNETEFLLWFFDVCKSNRVRDRICRYVE